MTYGETTEPSIGVMRKAWTLIVGVNCLDGPRTKRCDGTVETRQGLSLHNTKKTKTAPTTRSTKPNTPPTINDSTENTGTPKKSTSAIPNHTRHIEVNQDMISRTQPILNRVMRKATELLRQTPEP